MLLNTLAASELQIIINLTYDTVLSLDKHSAVVLIQSKEVSTSTYSDEA